MKQGSEKIYYFILAAAMMLILFLPGWAPGKFLFGLDTFTLHLPFLIYAKKAWQVFHDLPLWMPDIYMGMPAIDSANLMYFYPTNLLSILLPVPAVQSYIADLLIHMAAAGFGIFLFLRRHNISKQAAYFGAFVYMFSGPLVTCAYNGHWPDIKAIALVPYVFYFINRAIKEKRFFHYLSAGLFMALQVMGIGMQIAAYTWMAAVMYAAFMLYAEKAGKKDITNAAVFFTLATVSVALFSAPQFFPAQEYMRFSWRKDFPYDEFVNYSFNPAESIVLLLPQFFGLKDAMYWGFFSGTAVSYYCGLLPLLFAPFAFVPGKHRNISIFFLALAVFTMLMAFGGYTPLYKFLYNIPVFNKFRNPARILCLIPFILSFFASIGLNTVLERDKNSGKIFKVVFITAASLSALFLFYAANENLLKSVLTGIFNISRAKFTKQPMPEEGLFAAISFIREDVAYFIAVFLIFSGAIYLLLKERVKSVLVISILFCCVQFFDMWRVEKKFISYYSINEISPIDGAARYMKTDGSIFRFADLAFAWQMNRHMYYGLESFIGFHAILYDKMYNLLSGEAYKFKDIMRLFNVKYYLNTGDPDEFKSWGYKKVLAGPVNLFKDAGAMPRVFLTDRVKKLGSDDEILAYMKTSGFNPQEALVKDAVELTADSKELKYTASITDYTPNRIKISAAANKETLLVLSNMYYYRWKVMVDKKPERIYNIDYCIDGVKLLPGRHEVEFYYDRSFIVLCVLLMLAAFTAYAAVYFIEKRRKKGA